MPDHPHGEIQTHYVKPEDHSHPDRKAVTDGGVSDPCKSQAEQPHACAGLRVWAGPPVRAARTLWLQGEPSQPSETEAAASSTSYYVTWVALLYLKVQMEVPM